MTSPISTDLLVNTITIFNKTKDSDGNNIFYKSIIENVLILNRKRGFSMSAQGQTKQFYHSVIIDANNSSVSEKEYSDPRAWDNATAKENYFTLREDDIVILEEVPDGAIIPDTSSSSSSSEDIYYLTETQMQTLMNSYDFETIKEIVATQDFDGSIHNREITLG